MSAVILAGLPNPVSAIGEAVGGVVGGAASSAAESAFEFFLRRLAQALGNAANKVLTEVTHYLDSSSGISLDAGWFAGPRAREINRSVLVFAAALVLLFLLAAIVQGVARGDVGLMVRTAAVEVPLSVLGMAVLTSVTAVLLAVTDAVSSMVLATAPESLSRFFQFGEPDAILRLGLFGIILIPAFILGAILVWVELVVRSSLIYLLLAFSPVVLAARVWPALAGAWHQLCRLGIALIVSKFAIALALGLGAAALGGGGPVDGDLGTQAGLTVGGLVVGASLMVLAAFAPFVVLKLLPVFEAAVLAQGISRGPLRAAHTGAQSGYYVQGLRRLAGTGGPRPGTAVDAGASPAGPAPAGPGGGEGGRPGGGGGVGPVSGAPTPAGGGGAARAVGSRPVGVAAAAGGPAAGAAGAAMVPVGVAAKTGRTAQAVADRSGSSSS